VKNIDEEIEFTVCVYFYFNVTSLPLLGSMAPESDFDLHGSIITALLVLYTTSYVHIRQEV
jgi:hypothetical protein